MSDPLKSFTKLAEARADAKLSDQLAKAIAEDCDRRIAEAVRERDELRRERDEALKAVKICQSAARSLDASRQAVIRNLLKPVIDERNAAATLDSEREANALLTTENDALRAALDTAKSALEPIPKTLRGPSPGSNHARLDLSYDHLAKVDDALAQIAAITTKRPKP